MMVKVLEISRVSPLPGSVVAETSLPLTFFDVFHLQLPPIQVVFFCQFSDPTTYSTTAHFLNTLLPNLKHSLSLALQVFYPLCGNLSLSPKTGFPEIHYVDGDSISFCAAESSAADHFYHLVSNHPKDVAALDPLVPLHIPTANSSAGLLSVQVTFFPNSGICIGLSQHHAAADGRSVAHFIKSWSSICRTGDVSLVAAAGLPVHDRDLVKDPTGLKRIFSEQMVELDLGKTLEQMDVRKLENIRPLRATFVLTPSDIQRMKQKIMSSSSSAYYNKKPLIMNCSSFAVACGYMWVCLIKARGYAEDRTVYFSFPVDCRTRLDPPLPETYFGNCITDITTKALVRDLIGGDGLEIASKVIGGAVEELGSEPEGVLKGAEKLVSNLASLVKERPIFVTGSPMFRLNEMDFGWGRTRKSELVNIDKTGDIYMTDGAGKGWIEFCLVLPTSEMSLFTSFFEAGLRSQSHVARL